MPKPPARFSPLATTRSTCFWSTTLWSACCSALRPGVPNTSPIARTFTREDLPHPRSDPAADHAGLGDHHVERAIERSRRHLRDELRLEADADRQHRVQLRDCAVVVALP